MRTTDHTLSLAVDTTESEFSTMRSVQPSVSVEEDGRRKFVTVDMHNNVVFCLQKNTLLGKELRDDRLRYPPLQLFPTNHLTVH